MNDHESPYRPRPDQKMQALLDRMSADNQHLFEERERARVFAVIGWMLVLVAMTILYDVAATKQVMEPVDASVPTPVNVCSFSMTIKVTGVEQPNHLSVDILAFPKENVLFTRDYPDAFPSAQWRPLGQARSLSDSSIQP